MSPVVLLPLLATNLAAPAYTREVRASGLTVVAAAVETSRGTTDADVEVRGRGTSQRIRLRGRELGAQMLLSSVRIVDANFDGHPDIVVLREQGATWGALDVFLWDPTTHRFSNTLPLAAEMSRLTNVEIGARTITTRHIGPSNPSSATWVVEGAHLHQIASCRFVNPLDERVGTLIRSHGSHTIYTHVRLAATDVEPCGP